MTTLVDAGSPLADPPGAEPATSEAAQVLSKDASGSDGQVRLVGLSKSPIDVEELHRAVADERAGGIALFIGAVRDHDHGRAVTALTYEAHPVAARAMAAVAARVAARPDVVAVAAQHRVGALAVGDLAVVVAVSCAHRGDAFDAARLLIDQIKTEVPIWKWQQFRDGGSEWVACGAADDAPPPPGTSR